MHKSYIIIGDTYKLPCKISFKFQNKKIGIVFKQSNKRKNNIIYNCVTFLCELLLFNIHINNVYILYTEKKVYPLGKILSVIWDQFVAIAKMKPFLNGCSSDFLRQLQNIQNRACRIIFGLKRRDSVSPYLKSLHWLKVEQRIQFKVLLLTHKWLHDRAPRPIILIRFHS